MEKKQLRRFLLFGFLPPILFILLFLYFVNVGFYLLVSLPYFIYFLASVIIVIISVTRMLLKKRKLSQEQKQLFQIRIIRSTLFILFFILLINLIGFSGKSAEKYAEKIAKTIQIQCNKESLCPEQITGWQPKESSRWENINGETKNVPFLKWRKNYKKYGFNNSFAYYKLYNKEEFVVDVYNATKGRPTKQFQGGINKKLKEIILTSDDRAEEKIIE